MYIVFLMSSACCAVALGAEPEAVANAAEAGYSWLPWVCGIGGGSLGSAGMWVWSKLHRVQIEPQPLEVKMQQDFVTRQEFKALTDRVDSIVTDLSELKGAQNYQTKLLHSINDHLIRKAL